ncbi:RBCK1 [Acanthosepion pharaonis]|uniref:RBCK1 n=1 Tax=Acanthosepion pharaonis TaxID=158019 RepID=A0A812C7X9_ACAPH|nr:RBCK1 [Sepia pharaonis]
MCESFGVFSWATAAIAVSRPSAAVVGAVVKFGSQEGVRFLVRKKAFVLWFARRRSFFDTAQLSLVHNPDAFCCPICLDDIAAGEGVILQECLHSFCKDCLVHSICLNESGDARCLYQDDKYQCNAKVQESVIKALVPDEVYQRYLNIGLRLAESAIPNSYHCKTPNCQGWCIYEDDVNFFECPVCNLTNCLTCKAIHEGLNCKEFQAELDRASLNNSEAKRTKKLLEGMLKTGEAMRCPRCNVILSKKDGCDWLCCSICKLEICWATKGPRWGPAGAGDLSGGCKCNVDQVKCHPKCLNCH